MTANDPHIILDKELRRDIDAIIQRLKTGTGEVLPVLSGNPESPTKFNVRASRERAIVKTKLQEAVMWLGMDLKDINDKSGGAENPYPHSKDPTNTVIDQTADGLKL